LASGTSEQLKLGDAGTLVEDLQRTLNARLNPMPKISVDGEFGSETETAVKKFQAEHDLQANGIVAAETWKALGTLVTTDPPVPAPDVINGAELPVTKSDEITGPPLVTCKAWAIADAKTGEFLTGHEADTPRDFASTTKIMTAYLVLSLAEKQPEVLDEVITFSERADKTGGSTSAIRAGERVTIRELLYGLMLPSGNDASIALAEHFGTRVAGDTSKSDNPVELFVAQMNKTAQDLGMNNTTYKNAHGLTAKGHQSTAKDLTRLAHAAIQLPLFREYINTRKRGCTLVGPGGYQRNIVWENTNQLLGIEGYHGIKTGTTDAAGACLVSWGDHGEDSCLVVVLGSTSSDARYVDTRNLFRWWFREGGVKK
jgi:D-alanyl-D-alanine carboxypeptidase (penicillin-binding protein 5/6)